MTFCKWRWFLTPFAIRNSSMDQYLTMIIKNMLSLAVNIFQYLDAFKSKISSGWLNNTGLPIRGCVTFKYTKSWRERQRMSLRMVGKYGPDDWMWTDNLVVHLKIFVLHLWERSSYNLSDTKPRTFLWKDFLAFATCQVTSLCKNDFNPYHLSVGWVKKKSESVKSMPRLAVDWLIISVYLSSLPVAHLGDAPRRLFVVTGDSARIQDETTENSALFFYVFSTVTRNVGLTSHPKDS